MALIERKKFGSPTKKQVMIMMAMFINDPLQTDVWPSAVRLGLRCEISEKTVRRTWLDFVEDGLIKQVGEKSVRGGKIKVWRIDLRAIKRLKNCLPTLDEQLGELPDNLSSGSSTTGHSVPEPPDTEAQDHRTQCPTNSPEEESKGIVQTGARELSNKLWEMAPKRARTRSSKDKLLKAVQKALKKTDAQMLVRCYQLYLSDPEVAKQDYAFACGVHVWLNDSRWQGYEPVTDLLNRPAELSDLERCFESLGTTGHWPGERFGYPHPHSRRADYPAEMYSRFNVERRAA